MINRHFAAGYTTVLGYFGDAESNNDHHFD